ncbi:MAG: hypothetical protein V9F00_11285 [Nocardioides sp.]
MSLDSPAPASSGVAAERPSRAGRNLPVAIGVGVGLGRAGHRLPVLAQGALPRPGNGAR